MLEQPMVFKDSLQLSSSDLIRQSLLTTKVVEMQIPSLVMLLKRFHLKLKRDRREVAQVMEAQERIKERKRVKRKKRKKRKHSMTRKWLY
jgi:hypothetical protein